jgi:hypothetical protein
MVTSAVSVALLAAAQQSAQAATLDGPGVTQAANREPSNNAALQKYQLEGYNYIDAKVLAAYWGESTPYAAKLRMGRKMLMFGFQEGKPHIRDARSQALRKPLSQMPVWYTDGGYTFGDAELLGKFWGGGLENSKTKMARMLIKGEDARIKAALKAARRRA